MNDLYKTKQIGDILRLPFDLSHADGTMSEAGGYVLLSVGETCGLAWVTEAPDGALTTTTRLVYVPMADLCHFVRTGLKMYPFDL